MNTKIIYILAILLLAASFVQAQKRYNDYVVTTKGDTLAAKIRYDIWGHVVYLLPGRKDAISVDDGNIKEYHWLGNKYPTFVAVSLPNNGKPVFVALLERGKINLYEFVSHGSKVSTHYWYAGKDDLPAVEVNNERRLFGTDKRLIQNFSNLINDNHQISESFKGQHKYSLKTIQDLVRRYNMADSKGA
jgi:hypothetical protein